MGTAEIFFFVNLRNNLMLRPIHIETLAGCFVMTLCTGVINLILYWLTHMVGDYAAVSSEGRARLRDSGAAATSFPNSKVETAVFCKNSPFSKDCLDATSRKLSTKKLLSNLFCIRTLCPLPTCSAPRSKSGNCRVRNFVTCQTNIFQCSTNIEFKQALGTMLKLKGLVLLVGITNSCSPPRPRPRPPPPAGK